VSWIPALKTGCQIGWNDEFLSYENMAIYVAQQTQGTLQKEWLLGSR